MKPLAGAQRSFAGNVDDALRRTLDLAAATIALTLLSPLLLVLALLVRASSPGPVLFVQERSGRHGRPFRLLKLRTMRTGADGGMQITVDGDPRVTRVGRMLRRTKLDELPQLWNVLRGDMSLVGPRPEVPRYVAGLNDEQRAVLAVRPGITDPASIAFRDESELLSRYENPERAYRDEILPHKIALSLDYLARRTVWTDLGVLLRTAAVLLGRRPQGDATAGATASLGGQVVSGIKWSAVAYYSDSILRLGISILLARLLSPTEFGLIALATSVVGILALVQESGLSAALVQHRGALDPAATAALYLTFSAGVALSLATWITAPWIASYLDQPALASVLAPLSLLFLLHGLAHAPKAILQREMAFRALAAVRLAGTLAYGAIATGLAFAGYGVWSLVAATLLAEATLTAGCWLVCPWRPRSARFDWHAARELSDFGRHILGANVLSLARERLPVLVIGKLLGAELVGLYWMAQRWAALPVEGVTFVVARVSYPVYARLRDDPQRFTRAYTLTLQAILLLAAPAAIGLCLVAEPLVAALYDPRWQGAGTLLAILSFYGLFHAIAASTGEVFKAAGAPRLVLVYAIVYIVSLAGLLFVMRSSLTLDGVALAVTASSATVAVGALVSTCRLLRMPLRQVLAKFALPALGVAVMALVVLAVAHLSEPLGLPPWARVLLHCLTGAASYAAVILLHRRDWARYVATRAGIAPERAEEAA
jgi:lipopolysaccharide/colanic/teichoic acid biosynthesis glycosyltransferase/O-antigen/teichoic acid export membrane protein